MATVTTTAPEAAVDMQFMQMAAAKWMSKAISTAAELGVADHLAGGPKSAEELASAVGAHAPSLYRLMRALTLGGVFTELPGRRFELTPLSERLRSDSPHSRRNVARMLGADWTWRAWGELTHCVRTGETAEKRAFGMPAFEYLAQHPDEAAVFDGAMTDYSRFEGPAVAAAYDFGRFRQVVDVAGGHGALLFEILRAHSRPRGIVFDQPHVIEGTRRAIRESGLDQRCHAEAGDFFEDVVAGADAYVMKHIIHDWDDPRAIQILRNVRRAIAPGGRVLLCEVIVPEPGVDSFSKLLDLEMLVIPGGKERTVEEYRALLAEASFRMVDVHPTDAPVGIVEAAPA